MFKHLVMTVIGADRPGLVQLVASNVADHGGNWLESRMCHLGGKFAGVVRVEVAEERVPELRKALQELEAKGLLVTVDGGAETVAAGGGVARTLELVGADRPGLLPSVTRVRAGHWGHV